MARRGRLQLLGRAVEAAPAEAVGDGVALAVAAVGFELGPSWGRVSLLSLMLSEGKHQT